MGPRVAVIGGGISGLAVAHELRHGSGRPRPEVTLLEAGPALGGKVRTARLAGLPVETGPDTIGALPPQLGDLIDELGLAGARVTPGRTGSYLWSRGRLRRVPPGTLFGLSARPWPLLRSGLLSMPGVLRAGLDTVLPASRLPADPSIGELVRARFGAQVCERLVEPLLSGAYSGRADVLSAASTVPELADLARSRRSLYLGLLRQRPRSGPPPRAAFTTLSGGLSQLIDTLAGGLAGCAVRTATAVTGLRRGPDGYQVLTEAGPPVPADAVVLAVPAFAAADLLSGLSLAAAAALRDIRYADLASVTLAYPPQAVTRPLDATGFLVPPVEGRLITGCTWLPAKWPHLAGQPVTLLRCLLSADRSTHGERAPDWPASDDELVARVHTELVEAMGLASPPVQALVQRWPRGVPQYTVGHQQRVDRAVDALRELPGLWLTGAGYRGASLARCVAAGRQTAQRLVASYAAAAVHDEPVPAAPGGPQCPS